MFEAGQVTTQRMSALERLSSEFSLSNVVVFLLEDSYLKASYSHKCDQRVQEYLKNLQIPNLQKSSPTSIDLKPYIKKCMSECEGYPAGFEIQEFSLPDDLVPKIGTKSKVVGAITYQSNGKNIDVADLNLFALSISASRDHRIVEAVKVAQEYLKNGEATEVDDILVRVASILKKILGAERCYYMNSNKFHSWQSINEIKDSAGKTLDTVELVASTGVFALLLQAYTKDQTAYKHPFTLLLAVLFLVCAILCVWSFLPQSRRGQQKSTLEFPHDSLLYYKDVGDFTVDEYEGLISNIDNEAASIDRIQKDFVEQIILNSRIIDRKMRYFTLGVYLFLGGLIGILFPVLLKLLGC